MPFKDPKARQEYVRRWGQENRERITEHIRIRYNEDPEEATRRRTTNLRSRHSTYEATLEEADHNGEPWDAQEDEIILKNDQMGIKDLALILGRTSYAIGHRRRKLRRLIKAQRGELQE